MKFLKEQNFENDGRQYCNYMGRIVLSNRYQNYKNHSFISENEIKQSNAITRNNYLKQRINSNPFNKHRFRMVL